MTADELARLYDAHAAALFGYRMALTGSEDETREVIQEVFIRLGRSEPSTDAPGWSRAFLITVARRAAIDRVRRTGVRERRHLEAAAESAGLFAEPVMADAGLCRSALEAALGELPEAQRSAVILHVWTGLTFREIAAALDIPLHTAASRCRYGLAKLRQTLQPLYEELK